MARTVLITGCSSGIGRATAERFLKAGWTVYATAREEADVDDLGDRGCRTAALDVTDADAVERVVARAYDEHDHLNCLVNNAGYGQFGAIEEVPDDQVRRQFDVNTFGPLRLVRAVVPRMRERGAGTVANVTAGVGGLNAPGLGVYTASKFALESALDALRQELSGSGVDVVMVRPGAVATRFYDRVLAELEGLDRDPAYVDLYRALDSVGTVARGGPGVNPPERVAETVFRAGAAANPRPVYHVGAVAGLGTLTGNVVRGRARDAASRLGVKTVASRPVQRLLDRGEIR
jgi:NAD(P)-dependent dehydrogenase (short-subunit alcohol dehydrogenase family)